MSRGVDCGIGGWIKDQEQFIVSFLNAQLKRQ